RWGYQTGGHGWTAKELQYYNKANPQNVGVENGLLRISLTKDNELKKRRTPFSSTRLVTKRKADFEQGYFEVRAKFPEGTGLRSAIWMVGDTVSKIGWPHAGEIDLVEHYGKIPTAVSGAVQTFAHYWSGKGQLGGSTIVKTATEDFHVYSCTWTEDLLTFAVDGKPYWEYRPLPGQGVRGWPFQWPFYLVINLSTGGIRGAAKVTQQELETAAYPANLYVDYVRVYQKP
ncbi:MAG: glycoside hydrolase family 16 protein, partial [Bacteroidota bacterium]